jgi:hypothetical protein
VVVGASAAFADAAVVAGRSTAIAEARATSARLTPRPARAAMAGG